MWRRHACKEMGVCTMMDNSEQEFFRSLVYRHWRLFDGTRRSVHGAELSFPFPGVSRCPKCGWVVAKVPMHISSKHDGDRTLHVARLDAPRKLGRCDSGARATLRAVSGLVLAAQSCREDKDADVKWGRGWLSGGGSVGGESQLHPLGVLDGHAGPRGHHEVTHSKRSSLCRSCFIVSAVSVLLGVFSFFRAVSFRICLCVLALSECSRMGGPGPRSSDRIC